MPFSKWLSFVLTNLIQYLRLPLLVFDDWATPEIEAAGFFRFNLSRFRKHYLTQLMVDAT